MTTLFAHGLDVHPYPPGAVVLTVYGEPATQGSKKAFYNARIGRAIMTEQTSAKLNPWRADVTLAALRNREERGWVGKPAEPLDGPLVARVIFTVKKPSSAPKTRRTYPAKGKDVSKLLRALEDAITAAGLWRDDSRVIEYTRLTKVYPGEDPEALEVPGVRIAIWTINEQAQPTLDGEAL